jgi:DNA polymerase III delta prime subunit
VLIILPEKNDRVDIENGVISIGSIRRLYGQTRSIQTGRLIIVIDYAERMAPQAQSAFLKLLEEPGKGAHFILASNTPSKLLPTIASRMQSLELRPLTQDQTEAFLSELGIKNVQKRTQLLFMAKGLPAELIRLTENEAYFEHRATTVRDSRDLLQATIYQKLLLANRYKDDREGALSLLTTTMNILCRSISEKAESSLIGKIEPIQYAYQKIAAGGNIRLCLARLVL